MWATEAPVTPEPTMTYWDDEGRFGVVRWSLRRWVGVCQYACVGFLTGRPTGILVAVMLIDGGRVGLRNRRDNYSSAMIESLGIREDMEVIYAASIQNSS